MPYIGVPPADRTSGARVRDEFTGDGTQVCFQLSQEVPGSFESNLIAVVENVIQEPVESYTVINTVTIALTSISGTFTKNETVTGGTSSATGTVIQVNMSNIVVRVTSGTFQNPETVTGGSSSATATVSSLTTNVGRGLLFSAAPVSGGTIYVLHQNAATYQLKPAAGSVTPETLSENLRTFTVDKFTATSSQTDFTLSTTPVSVKSILVFVDGVMQTETTHYTLSGAVVTMGAGLASGQQVTVVHLGFSTVSRTAFADGTVTTAMIADGAITSDKIATGGVATIDMADGSVTSLKIANGGIATEDIADSAVTTDKINNDAVTQAKIADDAVGLDQLSATGTPDNTKFLRGDNSWQVVAVTPTAVSDQANSSTGYFALPSGTTAERPGSPVAGMIRHNTDNDVVETYDGTQWIAVGAQNPPYAVEYLVIAGGGGSGIDGGGGGGAGGLLYGTASIATGTGTTVTIGGGGTGANNYDVQPASGTNSTLSGALIATAIGGGGASMFLGAGGSYAPQTALSGGSGGGGAVNNNVAASNGGAGTSGQGFAGGNGVLGASWDAAGGGGAGGAGANNGSNSGGNGGVGSSTYSAWGAATSTGENVGGTYYYAGGGGGASEGGTAGLGGYGGGGDGGQTSGGIGNRGENGAVNTGGGAGGSDTSTPSPTSNGGSGIVIIRYAGAQRGSGGTVTSSGGYTYHTFTTSGTYTA